MALAAQPLYYDDVDVGIPITRPTHSHRTTLYARHALESVGLEKSKNCQKGWSQRIFNIKGVLMKRV